MRLSGEALIAFLPLILFIAVYRIGRGLLTGRLHGAKMKPVFGGRFSAFMAKPIWAFGFVATLVWAVGWLIWLEFR